MLDNSNFIAEKVIKGTKSLAYSFFCYIEINFKMYSWY